MRPETGGEVILRQGRRWMRIPAFVHNGALSGAPAARVRRESGAEDASRVSWAGRAGPAQG